MKKYLEFLGASLIAGVAYFTYGLVNTVILFSDILAQPDVEHVVFERGAFNINSGERLVSIFDLPFFGWGAVYGVLAGTFILVVIVFVNFKRPVQLLGIGRSSFLGTRNLFLLFGLYALISTLLENNFDILKSEDMNRMVALGKANPILTISTVGILIPFFEELVFRGWYYSRLESIFSKKAALWVTSVAFTLAHVQYNMLILILFLPMALLFGMIRSRTGSIWPSVVLHCANNTTAALVMFSS